MNSLDPAMAFEGQFKGKRAARVVAWNANILSAKDDRNNELPSSNYSDGDRGYCHHVPASMR